MNFGDKLYHLRRKNGFSQEELGEKLNVTRQTISKWELGQSKPDTDKLMEISKLLNVDFNTLADNSIKLDNNNINNDGISTDEVKPRIWLLVVLIVIALVIIIVLSTKFIGDRRAKAEDKKGIFDIFNIFDEFTSSTGLGSSFEAASFNSKFEYDTGTNSGFFISDTIDNIITNNKINKEHLITLIFEDINTTDPVEIKNAKRKLEESSDYEVSADYDDDGFINKITIEPIENETVISDFDIRSFNSSYEMYAGTEWGSSVSRVLDKIITNNKTKPDRIIRVIYGSINTTDENEIRNIKSKLDEWKTDYEVILDYDEIGFVNQVTIQN